MKVICVINKKGGVAKTTTSLALGAGLRKKGYSVLFIDMDSQCNLSMCAGADTDGKSLLGVLTEQIRIEDAIQQTPMGDVVPAELALAGADSVITETGKEYRMKEALASVKKRYDFVIYEKGMKKLSSEAVFDQRLLFLCEFFSCSENVKFF